MEKIKKHKKDILFIVVSLLVGLFLLVYVLMNNKTGQTVTVSVSGNIVWTHSLLENTEYMIQGKDGGTNKLIIKDGYAYMESASCPDSLCIHMGKIRASYQSIICLPNEVVVEITDSIEDDVDLIIQ